MASVSNHINKKLLPKSAAEAKQQGSKFFYSGKPCKHGLAAAGDKSTMCQLFQAWKKLIM